jgi:hypothetical protein
MREDMWQSVKSRKHAPQKVYANDSEGDDLMLFGTVRLTFLASALLLSYRYGQVSYTLPTGTKIGPVGWGGRMVFDDDEALDYPRLSFYQARFVSSESV